MTKAEIIASVAEATDTTKATVEKIYTQIFNEMMDSLLRGEDVPTPLGSIVVADRAARAERSGRNPKTGEAITIPAKPESKTLKLKVKKSVKESLN